MAHEQLPPPHAAHDADTLRQVIATEAVLVVENPRDAATGRLSRAEC